nr:hypothetical protein BaRGS_016324 [Batillaria attramentaria]
MKYLILASLLAFAYGQISGDWRQILAGLRDRVDEGNSKNDDVIDTYHNWRVEEHTTDTDHMLLFINDLPDSRYCYVVKVGRSWEHLLTDQNNVYRITEEIYAIITDPNHRERELRPEDLAYDYSDFDAARECRGHDTYSIRYTPDWDL